MKTTNQPLSVRRIPYPYRAMLAICSDLDETPDHRAYVASMKYLNDTVAGQGFGLEVGNSLYFDMPAGQLSYWNTDDRGRASMRTLMRSGHIDCLHSYGDLALSRAQAGRALEELDRYGCKLEVWIDHGRAPSNFGRDIMRGQGDIEHASIYHADLTTDYGIRYVWLGRVTSVIGQDVRRSLKGIGSCRHPLTSLKTLGKEYLKGFLARRGNAKYAMHGHNHLLRKIQLRSGQKVYEFMRSNPHWGGISQGETARGLAEVLTDKILTRLTECEGVAVLYTHLGKHGHELFNPSSKKALERLARYSREKKILVTTTSRLLRYCQTVQDLKVSVKADDHAVLVDLSADADAGNCEGVSFYVPDRHRIQVTVNKREVKPLQYNVPDHTGQSSVSVPWHPLVFPGDLS